MGSQGGFSDSDGRRHAPSGPGAALLGRRSRCRTLRAFRLDRPRGGSGTRSGRVGRQRSRGREDPGVPARRRRSRRDLSKVPSTERRCRVSVASDDASGSGAPSCRDPLSPTVTGRGLRRSASVRRPPGSAKRSRRRPRQLPRHEPRRPRSDPYSRSDCRCRLGCRSRR